MPHKRLISKLKAYGIKGKLLKWINSFLSDRLQRVVMGDFVSVWVVIFSGVPQGSVLGPILFIIFINDPAELLHHWPKLYADDTKILAKLVSEEAVSALQRDLDTVAAWSSKWLVKLNSSNRLILTFAVYLAMAVFV